MLKAPKGQEDVKDQFLLVFSTHSYFEKVLFHHFHKMKKKYFS